MSRMPVLYLSHGAPTLAIEPAPARDFLQGLGARLGKPKAILMISAHWETSVPTVSLAEQPETIHDFGGFPDELFRMRYPAPGSPALARRVSALLEVAGLPCRQHPDRGLDHGAWIPLKLMYPEADVPVVQLSIMHGQGAEAHWRLGEALRPLREEGVLIVGSGSATHNLYELGRYARVPSPPEWVSSFDRWLAQAVTEGRQADLVHYLDRAPNAQRNHPTPDHILPLFVAAGAAGTPGELLHESYMWGIISMASYAFA